MKAIGIVGCALLAFAAQASIASILDLQAGDQVKAALDGALVSPRVGGITLQLDGQTYGVAGSNHYVGPGGVWAGVYLVDIYDLSNTLIFDNYPSVCMDIKTEPVRGATQVHTVLDNVAADMEKMWATYHGSVVGDAVKAAAFQLAVWEIMHEDVGTNGYDLGAGDFLLYSLNTGDVDNNGATLSGLISQANAYLNSGNWTADTNLMSLYREGYQPLAVEVPEPATMILLVLGGLTLLARRRR